MFPGLSVTSFSAITEPSKFMTEDPTKLFNALGYYYSIGLMQQLDELQNISDCLFQGIEQEFDALKKRMDDINAKYQSLKQKVPQSIEKLSKVNATAFIKNPCRQMCAPIGQNQDSISLGMSNNLVQVLYSIAKPPPTLEAWKPLIPDYQNLDKLISNPESFMDMFKAEMLRDCQNLVNQKHKGEGKKKRSESLEAKTEQALNVMIVKVLPLPTLVQQPPPVGKTTGWNKPLTFKSSITSSSEDVAFAAATVKPAILSTPEQRKRTPRPAPKPIQLPDPTPAPTPAPAKSSSSKSSKSSSSSSKTSSKAAPAPAPAPAAPPAPAAAAPPPPPPPLPKSTGSAPPPPPPSGGGGMSHLDLIKQGNFKLKKASTEKPKEEPKKNVDPNALSVGELLQYMASIRADVEASDDEEGEDESSSEDW
ncbi:hypothetical protein TVAG_078700 [Trichomonas vaginalis G3]|uniref:BHLH domain-containing protein n=1 Tax=Trichomonas vaginalis (strain ATCC PRA-98 / G3) TaxID=412133 RepID=A2G6R9_TRIV3|nr:lamellipodium morphogenesis protein family [Trichomonas vaginalis G3]EAX87145.1 hypothetical protein TVAG_078700 [Trichomonas vaginalis G3]KAI5546965.1 lamellipodium morphogenesis protein family [Trichomonas vaginalis G3]|eukprot:XP_001300075.1 hypothetical protein [Trichomonas vaginalis G3]